MSFLKFYLKQSPSIAAVVMAMVLILAFSPAALARDCSIHAMENDPTYQHELANRGLMDPSEIDDSNLTFEEACSQSDSDDVAITNTKSSKSEAPSKDEDSKTSALVLVWIAAIAFFVIAAITVAMKEIKKRRAANPARDISSFSGSRNSSSHRSQNRRGSNDHSSNRSTDRFANSGSSSRGSANSTSAKRSRDGERHNVNHVANNLAEEFAEKSPTDGLQALGPRTGGGE